MIDAVKMKYESVGKREESRTSEIFGGVHFAWEMDVMAVVAEAGDWVVLEPTLLKRNDPHGPAALLVVAVRWAVADIGWQSI